MKRPRVNRQAVVGTVLEYVWIDAFSALNPERAMPWPFDRIRFKDKIALRGVEPHQLAFCATTFHSTAIIKTGNGACNHIFAMNPAQRRRIDTARIIHERNKQAPCQVSIYHIRHMLPARHILGNVNGKTWDKFKSRSHQHNSLELIIPNPTRIRIHSTKNGIGNGNSRGHKYTLFRNAFPHRIIANS